MSLRAMFKGWLGEAQGALAHLLFLDRSVYHTLNNVTLATANGTTQIDHVIVSRHGIFVIEAKNMKGWIFGNERDPQWTQSFTRAKSRDCLAAARSASFQAAASSSQRIA